MPGAGRVSARIRCFCFSTFASSLLVLKYDTISFLYIIHLNISLEHYWSRHFFRSSFVSCSRVVRPRFFFLFGYVADGYAPRQGAQKNIVVFPIGIPPPFGSARPSFRAPELFFTQGRGRGSRTYKFGGVRLSKDERKQLVSAMIFSLVHIRRTLEW